MDNSHRLPRTPLPLLSDSWLVFRLADNARALHSYAMPRLATPGSGIDSTRRDSGGHAVQSIGWRPILAALVLAAGVAVWLGYKENDPGAGGLFMFGALALVPFSRPVLGAAILAGMPHVMQREAATIRQHARATRVWFLSLATPCMVGPIAALQNSYSTWTAAGSLTVCAVTAWVFLTLEPLVRYDATAHDGTVLRRMVRQPLGAMVAGYCVVVLLYALIPAAGHLLHRTAWTPDDSHFVLLTGWLGALIGVMQWDAHVGDAARDVRAGLEPK